MNKEVYKNFTRVSEHNVEVEYHSNGIAYITQTRPNGELMIVRVDYDTLMGLLEAAADNN